MLEPRVAREEHGLHAGQMAVHQRHRQLVVEVGPPAQALDDDARADLSRDVHEQPAVELLDPHAGQVGGGMLDEPHPLTDGERPGLVGVVEDRHDELVCERCSPSEDVHVTEGHGVVGTGADGDAVHDAQG